ncbi:MAG: hypothetical protein Q9191_003457 [Dirinaria sp. TL-2023a]
MKTFDKPARSQRLSREIPRLRLRGSKLDWLKASLIVAFNIPWSQEKADLSLSGAKGRKAAAKRLQKLNRRREQRESARLTPQGAGDEEEEEDILGAAAEMYGEEEADEEADQTPSSQNSPPPADKRTGDNQGEAPLDGDSDSNATEYEVLGIQDDRVNDDGVTEYLIDWKPINGKEYEPSWEPERNVSSKALETYAFYKSHPRSAAPSRGRGHDRGRGRGRA